MALDHKVNSESFEKLDDAVKPHYKQDGDDYFLQATGLVPKKKLDEFRDNNTSLLEKDEKNGEKIADLTNKLKIATEGSSEEKVKQLVEDGIGKRTKAMQDEHKAALEAALGRASTAENALSGLVVSDAVQREAIAAGVKDTAIDDVLTRAGKVFRVVDNKAIPYDGDDPIYGVDGSTPQTVSEWLAVQAEIAPHLFKESTGSGAKKPDGGGATSKTKTRKELESLSTTDRMEFFKDGGKVTN